MLRALQPAHQSGQAFGRWLTSATCAPQDALPSCSPEDTPQRNHTEAADSGRGWSVLGALQTAWHSITVANKSTSSDAAPAALAAASSSAADVQEVRHARLRSAARWSLGCTA